MIACPPDETVAAASDKEAPDSKVEAKKRAHVLYRTANLTWEHFFVTLADAVKYETFLISHRMDTLTTFRESMALIIEYGRISIGDKPKVVFEAIQKLETTRKQQRKSDGRERAFRSSKL